MINSGDLKINTVMLPVNRPGWWRARWIKPWTLWYDPGIRYFDQGWFTIRLMAWDKEDMQ